jgi:hypothetical protein
VSTWLDGTNTPRSGAGMEDEMRVAAMALLGGKVLMPFHPYLVSTQNSFTANDARGVRMVMPRAGTIRDMAIFVMTQSGNVDIGLYDTASGTSSKIWSSGSVSCGAATAWQIVGDPNQPVTQGQHIDFVLACDNATAAFARCAAPVSNLLVQLPTNYMISPQGALPKTAWRGVTSFPLPGSFTEAAKTVSGGSIPFIIARLV